MFFFTKDNVVNFKAISIETAYLAILNEDLDTANSIFKSIDSPRAKWGIVLVDIIKGFIEHYPTYFDIRNFLEIDLDFFIKNEKIDYVEMVLGSLEILISINQETYKYIARVLLENNLRKLALEYLKKSKDVFYNDPELHFLLAKFYFKEKDYQKADFYIMECLKILPDYYPAKIFHDEIIRYLA